MVCSTVGTALKASALVLVPADSSHLVALLKGSLGGEEHHQVIPRAFQGGVYCKGVKA